MIDAKILIVDDEPELRELVKEILKSANYHNILTSSNAKEAKIIINQSKPDLILLDLMLPDEDGMDLLKEIREVSKIPVILLTAKGEMEDKYMGFEYGADDYIVKPFYMKELLYRIEALLKRTLPVKKVIELNDSIIDLDQALVTMNGKQTNLTARELEIFLKLYENEGRIVSLASLCQTAVGDVWTGYESTMMSHIRNLRKKIEKDPSHPKSLITIRGLGYRLNIKNEHN